MKKIPVPKPRTGEEQDEFISRCISTLHRTDPDRSHEQIIAMCFDTWRRKEQVGVITVPAPTIWSGDIDIHPDFLWILKKYIRQWGEKIGVGRFLDWVEKAKVIITKPYLISTQRVQECLGGICESFYWAEPLISYLKEDEDATYWKATALTANVSMNRNDYENAYELAKASGSMREKPLNWNHNHKMWLPFPEARVDLASFEDNALECIIRIPNDLRHYENRKLVNDMIRDGDIIHVSVEGDPKDSVETAQGVAPIGYKFTALAILENDKTLPGDPLTTLEPLFLRESMGRSLVESLKEEVKNMNEGIHKEETPETKEEKQTRTSINDLPNETKEMIEEGIQGMDVCGQCSSFRDLDNAVVRVPALTGAEDSREVIKISGAIGPGVGFCEVAKQLVRKNDAACTDGRPRTEATDLDRIIENTEVDGKKLDEVESVNELVLKSQLADKDADLLRERLAHNADIDLLNERTKELTIARDTLARKEKEIAVLTTENTRYKKERDEFYEQLDREKKTRNQAELRADSLDKDKAFYKDENDRLNEILDKVKTARITAENERNKALEKANDISAKYAEARQRAINAEADKARAVREVAELTEQLSDRTKELSESDQKRADTSKRELKWLNRVTELETREKKLIEEIRELKGKIETLKKTMPRKITVKA